MQNYTEEARVRAGRKEGRKAGRKKDNKYIIGTEPVEMKCKSLNLRIESNFETYLTIHINLKAIWRRLKIPTT